MCHKIALRPVLILTALLIACCIISCLNPKLEVVLNGTINSTNDYVVSISGYDSVLNGENITKGQFKIALTLPEADFYTLNIHRNGGRTYSFPIYLTAEQYTISFDTAKIEKYPAITSTSNVQNDLTAFHSILERKPDSLDAARGEFLTRYPNSLVSAFLLSEIREQKIEYEPEVYLAQYSMLGAGVKESKYARNYKKIIDKYMNGRVNSTLPDISGVQIDGAPFDKNSLKGKITLLMFWRSLNKDSRNDVVALLNTYEAYHLYGFEIVTISFDSSKERWKKFIRDNQLPWVSIYDPEGIQSDNIRNFGNTTIPYYFLVGPDLKIIERNPPVESIPIYIKEFIQSNKK